LRHEARAGAAPLLFKNTLKESLTYAQEILVKKRTEIFQEIHRCTKLGVPIEHKMIRKMKAKISDINIALNTLALTPNCTHINE
jgi:hypothetical protein